MKDIILINLPTNAWYKKEFSKNNAMPPLGLMYIATVLQNNHFDVDLIDFSVTIAILLISANSRCVEPPFAIVRTYCF